MTDSLPPAGSGSRNTSDFGDSGETVTVQGTGSDTPVPGAVQYPRKLSFILGTADGQGLDFSQFRVTFQIRRGDNQTPNSCDARIYNLNSQTAARIQNEFTNIQVQAGYPANFGLIFRGTIKQVRKGRENQTDNYVDITAADGDEAYNYSPIAVSLAAGHTPQNAIEAFLQPMAAAGVRGGYGPNLTKSGCTRGKVYYGLVTDQLRVLAEQNDCVWSIQDGELTFIPKTGYIPSGGVPIVSAQTGMIGVPEQTQNGLCVRTLLNPQYRIGTRVQLKTNAINQLRYGLDALSLGARLTLELGATKLNADGYYYVMQANHQGDTRGEPWWTDLTCLAIDATQIPDASINSAAPIAPLDVIKQF